MAEFDPDAYLAQPPAEQPAFDPDAYLKQQTAAPTGGEFNRRTRAYREAIQAGRYDAADQPTDRPAGADAPVGTPPAQPGEMGPFPATQPELRHDLGKEWSEFGKELVPGAIAGVGGLGLVGDTEELLRKGVNRVARGLPGVTSRYPGDNWVDPHPDYPTTVEGGFLGPPKEMFPRKEPIGGVGRWLNENAPTIEPAKTESEKLGRSLGAGAATIPGTLAKAVAAPFRAAPKPTTPMLPKQDFTILDYPKVERVELHPTPPPAPPPRILPFEMHPDAPVAVPRGEHGRVLPPDVPHTLPPETETIVPRGMGPRRAGVGAEGAAGPLDNISAAALQKFKDNLLEQGWTRHTIEALNEEMSAQQFLFEASPSLMQDMQKLARYTGDSKNQIHDSLTARHADQPVRFDNILDRAFGEWKNLAQEKRALTAEQKANQANYRVFEALEIPPTPALQKMLPHLEREGVLKEAKKWAERNDVEFNMNAPTARDWDLIKKGLDKKIEDNLGDFGKHTAESRYFTGLKKQLINEIDNHPDPNIAGKWKAARDGWASPEKLKSSHEFGQKLMTETIDKSELPYLLETYSRPELDAIAAGVRYYLENKMGRPGPQGRRTINEILSPNNEAKVRQIIGDERADALIMAMRHEEAMHNVPTRVLHGSDTAFRLDTEGKFANPKTSATKVGETVGELGELIKEPKKTLGKWAGKAATKQQEAKAEAAGQQLRSELASLYLLQGPERVAVLHWIFNADIPKASGGRVTKRAEGGKVVEQRSVPSIADYVPPKIQYMVEGLDKGERHELRGSLPLGGGLDLTGKAHAYPETNRYGAPVTAPSDWGASIGLRKNFALGGTPQLDPATENAALDLALSTLRDREETSLPGVGAEAGDTGPFEQHAGITSILGKVGRGATKLPDVPPVPHSPPVPSPISNIPPVVPSTADAVRETAGAIAAEAKATPEELAAKAAQEAREAPPVTKQPEAVETAPAALPESPPALPQADEMVEPPLASIMKRGEEITPPPPPDEAALAAAKADTRVSNDIVGERLDVIVPQSERVAGGTYTPGAPGGGRWADLPQEMLDRPGLGFKVSDDELRALWQQAVDESSQAAKNAVAETGAVPTFPAKDWDAAMSLPLRDHLWYELSGERLAENLPDLTPRQFMKLMDLIGATSARADPAENLERALGVLSQYMRGKPVDVDVTTASAVRGALARDSSTSSALPGNKTGYFSDTLSLTGGVPTRFPISVNDVWVGKMFGIADDVMSSNQSLHEPMAKYFNKIRDLYNERHGADAPFTYQSWNFQAPSWVHSRAVETGATSGDAYHQVWGNIVGKLKAAGVKGIEGDVITKEALMDPKFADALRRTTGPWRDAPKATVEFNTTQTNIGKAASDLYRRALETGDLVSQREYETAITSVMYNSARGKDHAWDQLKKAITGDVTQRSNVTRIAHPTSDAPLDVGGSFEGAVSPNIRIPLQGMNDDQLRFFNAMAGRGLKQDAVPSSTVRLVEPASAPAADAIRGHSLFVPTAEQITPEHLRSFAKAINGTGHEMSYVRYPNGYQFDVNPNFAGDVPKGADRDALEAAYINVLQPNYPGGKAMAHDFKSVYTTSSEYTAARRELIKGIQDDFLRQAKAAGVEKGAARAALGSSAPPNDVTGRGKRAWLNYRSRLDRLADAENKLQDFAKELDASHRAFVDTATRRMDKAARSAEKKKPATDTPARRDGGAVLRAAVRRAIARANGGGVDDGPFDTTWVDSPDLYDAAQAQAARSNAARAIARSVRRDESRDVPQIEPPPPEAYPTKQWMVAPDLVAQQSGDLDEPPGVRYNDADQPYDTRTGKLIDVIPRPGFLPFVRTPEGFEMAMPKALDLASNAMGGFGVGAKVPVKGGEAVFGSGFARTGPGKDSTGRGFMRKTETSAADPQFREPTIVGTDAVGRPKYDWQGAGVYHFTDNEGAADIAKNGYRVVGDGYYGEAVSFTPNRDYGRQFGGVETRAVVDPSAKILDSADPAHSEVIASVLNDHSLRPNNPGKEPGVKTWREAFLEKGYDGLYDAGAGDLFIYNTDKIHGAKGGKTLLSDTRPQVAGAVAHQIEKGPTADNFAALASKGRVRQALSPQQDLENVLERRVPATDFEITAGHPLSEVYETGELSDQLRRAGLAVDDDKMGRVLVGTTPENLDAMRSASTPAQYGRVYGYPDEDIARFYLERARGDQKRAYADYVRDTANEARNQVAGQVGHQLEKGSPLAAPVMQGQQEGFAKGGAVKKAKAMVKETAAQLAARAAIRRAMHG